MLLSKLIDTRPVRGVFFLLITFKVKSISSSLDALINFLDGLIKINESEDCAFVIDELMLQKTKTKLNRKTKVFRNLFIPQSSSDIKYKEFAISNLFFFTLKIPKTYLNKIKRGIIGL
jgi:hypothetical protein